MSFHDDLTGLIRSALAEKEAELSELAAFDAEWRRLRESLVLHLFREAAKAFEQFGEARPELINGSVQLVLGFPGGTEATLKFSPDKSKRSIVPACTFQDEPDEAFTLDHLTEEAVRDKVERFVYHVVRGKKMGKRSRYERSDVRVI